MNELKKKKRPSRVRKGKSDKMGSNLSSIITECPEENDDTLNLERPIADTLQDVSQELTTSSKKPLVGSTRQQTRKPVKRTRNLILDDSLSDEELPKPVLMPKATVKLTSQQVPEKTPLKKSVIENTDDTSNLERPTAATPRDLFQGPAKSAIKSSVRSTFKRTKESAKKIKSVIIDVPSSDEESNKLKLSKKLASQQLPEKTPRKTPNKKLIVAAESCRKITEFFTKTPSKTPEKSQSQQGDADPATFQDSQESVPILQAARRRLARQLSSSSSELLVPCTNQDVEPVRRKRVTKKTKALTKSTNLRQVTRKYFGEDQKRMTTFYEKTTEDPIGYLTRIEKSGMPTINTGDLNMEDFLHVSVKVEEAGTVQLNDRTLTMEELNERFAAPEGDAAFDPERHNWDNELNVVAVQLKKADDSDVEIHPTPEKEIIVLSDDDSREPPVPPLAKTNAIKAKPMTVKPKTPAPRSRRQKKAVVCPPYKIVAGTTFAVDAFQFGKIEGVSHYFLTHYHADHYMGLKKSFDMPLILSEVTARLVQTFIKVNPELMRVIQLHKPITIDGVEITALDANHCPGAVMFFFRLPNGTKILHTGDFRASHEMESEPLFWNYDLDTIYLDTTYLSSKYRFCHQSESISAAMEIVANYKMDHIGDKFLIVIGSYLIGKEKVWANIAKAFNLKVWAEKQRRQALDAIGDPDMLAMLVDDPKEADIHVLNMGKVYYDELKEYFTEFEDIFLHMLAIRPSGWEKNSKPQLRGHIRIYGVEYSEHSSLDELERFVRFTKPKTIISTVPTSRDLYKTGCVPREWYESRENPRRSFQPSLSSYVVVNGKKA